MSGTMVEALANAEATRVKAEAEAKAKEVGQELRRLKAAPEIAAAQAEARRIEQESQDEAEAAERERIRRREEETARQRAEAAEKERLAAADRRSHLWACTALISCLALSLPLQALAFWKISPFLIMAPIALEGLALIWLQLAAAEIERGRPAGAYRLGAMVIAMIVASVNLIDGMRDFNLAVGIAGALCSLAGPLTWDRHEQSRWRAKTGEKTWHQRRKEAKAEQKRRAEAAAREAAEEKKQQAAEEKEASKAKKAREEADAQRKALEEAEAAERAAREKEIAEQDARRKEHYPEAFEMYERILSAYPLGAISRDQAWALAQTAVSHREVWEHYRHLETAHPDGDPYTMWRTAWERVTGFPVLGMTAETAAAHVEAARAANEVLTEASRVGVEMLPGMPAQAPPLPPAQGKSIFVRSEGLYLPGGPDGFSFTPLDDAVQASPNGVVQGRAEGPATPPVRTAVQAVHGSVNPQYSACMPPRSEHRALPPVNGSARGSARPPRAGGVNGVHTRPAQPEAKIVKNVRADTARSVSNDPEAARAERAEGARAWAEAKAARPELTKEKFAEEYGRSVRWLYNALKENGVTD